MSDLLKKILAVIPFFLLVIEIVYSRFGYLLHNELEVTTILNISLNTVPFIIFALLDVLRRNQESTFQMVIQASFYIYVLSVFYLTLFPLSLESFLTNTLWSINLEPFNIFRDYHFFDSQIVGNFIMLFPLGVYLHFLYRKFTTIVSSLVFIFFVSFLIEVFQLVFSAGSTDIDDIILNTVGGYLGYWCFKVSSTIYYKKSDKTFNTN